MRLVGDHRIAPAGKPRVLVQRIEQRREGLDGDDDDARLLGQCFGQLLGFALAADIAGERLGLYRPLWPGFDLVWPFLRRFG